MRKIRIIHTENATQITGAFRKLYDYIQEEKVHTESVVVLPKGSVCSKRFEEIGVKVYELPFVEIGYDLKRILLYIPYLIINSYRLKKIVEKENIDILKCNDFYNLSLWMVRYFWCVKKPLIVHVRLLETSYLKRLYWFWRWLHIKTADQIIAVSYAAKKDYFNHPKVHVVYGGALFNEHVEEYKFTYDASRPFNFLYLSNFIRGKGNHYAAKALKTLVQQNKNVHLTFVGGTFDNQANEAYLEEIKRFIMNNGLQEYVTFVGFTKDTEALMKSYDCILNFSESESLSMVSFDALRFGIPLISTDCGGPAELMINNETGLLVKNKSTKEMFKAMLKLSTDLELCKKFHLSSKKYIVELYERTDGYEYITDVYRRELERYNSKK